MSRSRPSWTQEPPPAPHVWLRVEFMRSARPGTLRAEARVVNRTRRVAFCSGELYDAERTLLAASRCTQIVRG